MIYLPSKQRTQLDKVFTRSIDTSTGSLVSSNHEILVPTPPTGGDTFVVYQTWNITEDIPIDAPVFILANIRR